MLAPSHQFGARFAPLGRHNDAAGSALRSSESASLRSPNRTQLRTVLVDAKKRRLNPVTVRKLEQSTNVQEPIMLGLPTIKQEGRAHTPVMLEEAMQCLEVHKGGLFVDATFGMGGHTRSILKNPKTRVIGVDRDSSVLSKALEDDSDLRKFATTTDRLALLHGRFSNLSTLLETCKGKVDGILMDIGVSSVQLDSAGRGFSYREGLDAPLDMRMDQNDTRAPTAYDLVNTFTESKLTEIIWKYGEEKRARTIARAICERRRISPIQSTFELAKLISENAPRGGGKYLYPGERIAEYSKRTFQALRIEVNQELAELQHGLLAAETLLRPGGRLVVISFHSLEDRIVKNFFAEASGKAQESLLHPDIASAVQPLTARALQPTFDSVLHRASKASTSELEANTRARAAKLRSGIRTSFPPRS